jgi:hypothetical protein
LCQFLQPGERCNPGGGATICLRFLHECFGTVKGDVVRERCVLHCDVRWSDSHGAVEGKLSCCRIFYGHGAGPEGAHVSVEPTHDIFFAAQKVQRFALITLLPGVSGAVLHLDELGVSRDVHQGNVLRSVQVSTCLVGVHDERGVIVVIAAQALDAVLPRGR